MNKPFGLNSQTIKLSLPEPSVLLITLSRPEVRNALNTKMMSELLEIWTGLYRDTQDLRAVVITGEGELAFCAGADLKERNGVSNQEYLAQHKLLEQMIRALYECPIPVIAAANGTTYGGGLEILLACDFAYASDTAKFAFPETKLGIIPGAMGTQFLPRAVGIRRAKEICMLGEPFDAEQALKWGLVNKIIKSDALLSSAIEAASKIGACSPLATKQVKLALDSSQNTDVSTGHRLEVAAYNTCVISEDRLEGIRAFNEKRKPNFKSL